MADYAVEFDTLAGKSSWNKPALLCMFRRGPNDMVHDALITGTRQENLTERIDRANELDNYQRP